MDSPEKASESLTRYISVLLENYKKLLDILRLESEDIKAVDAVRLSLHVGFEQETVKNIISLTRTIDTYLENTSADDNAAGMLREIEVLRITAVKAGETNIGMLKSGMESIKSKIQSIKLPQSARRVYYSGNNSTLMDIEI